MEGVNPPQQQQAMTPEEEFLKRNTDCVYFLASPLTCKKGSECEYRHSEIARVNPRDCWYWLNGNCLNPKCAFRHPPLDGLLGAEIPTLVAPPMPQMQTPAVPSASSPYVMSKQGVPCIFFQKGYCLKGDKCPFLHPSTSASSKVAPSTAAAQPAPIVEPPIAKKTFGGLEKCTTTHEQKVLQTNIPKAVELPPQKKSAARVQVVPARNGVFVDKNVVPPSILGDELPRYRPRSIPPPNEISSGRSNRGFQAHIKDSDSSLNWKDADEFSREPSPGFDVLVDDQVKDTDYYHSEEQFERARVHEGRNMNPVNDYDLGRSSIADGEQDMYRDSRDYDSYRWEEQRRSSERILGGPCHVQRRRDHPRDKSPNELMDLRQRISKQKSDSNGLRSVVSREHTRDNHAEDRDYRRGPRRESHMAVPLNEGALSNRLRGRIKMPGRSISPVNNNEPPRHRGRLSPVRSHTVSSQARLRDRIKGRVQEDFPEERRDFRGGVRRDGVTGNEFSGPKRLSELKGGRVNDSRELQINGPQSLGKRKYPKGETEDDLSFEGPKPLSEILKRKKGAGPHEARSGEYNNNEGNNETGGKESKIKSTVYDSNNEVSNYTSAETEKTKATEEEIEEGLIGDDAMEEQELENFDNREGDFEYEEQVEGEEEYNLEEGEEEYNLDEDDGDDFAKQMGVELS